MPHDIFLSYSRADTDTMRQIYDHLTRTGFSVWIDQTGIPPGTASWKKAIEKAIDDAQCLVVIFSPEAKESKWVGAEMDYAEAQQKLIFPMLVRGNTSNAVPFGYSTAQWVDIRDKQNIAAEIQQLAQEIGNHIGKANLSAPRINTPPPHPSPPTQSVSTDQPSPPIQQTSTTSAVNLINLHLPQNQFRLLWWMFIQPEKLVSHRQQTGETTTELAAWLASLLIWLPMLIPTLAAGLGIIPLPTPPFGVPFPIWSVVIVLTWLITIWLWNQKYNDTIALMFGALGGVLGGIAVGDGFAVSVIVGAVIVGAGLVIGKAGGIVAGAVFGSVFGVVYGTFGTFLGAVTAIVMSGVAVAVVFGIKFGVIETNFETLRSSLLSKLLFAFLVFAYASLIWIYWLGGWRAFS